MRSGKEEATHRNLTPEEGRGKKGREDICTSLRIGITFSEKIKEMSRKGEGEGPEQPGL